MVIVDLLGSAVVTSLLCVVVHKRLSKLENVSNKTENIDMLTEILESGLSNKELSNSAQSVATILKRYYKMSCISILVHNKDSSSLDVIATTVDKESIQDIEHYCASVLNGMRKVTSKLLISDNTITEYESASIRGIKFSAFVPLVTNNELIGVLLLESNDSKKMYEFNNRNILYDKVMKSTSLVLNNIIYTENLISLASVDQLTGVYNRRYIDTTLNSQFNLHFRFGMSFTVAMLDIDHFKLFNDTYGHQAGDYILKEVATLLKKSLSGEHDWVARYGGEEFVLFFGRSNLEPVAKRVDEIRESIAKLKLIIEGKVVRVTASFGIASFPNVSSSYTDVISKADLALYKSKGAGRNKVTVYKSK